MNFNLTETSAKHQAKNLVSFLKTAGAEISYGTALEAVARMYDSKSWNHLSAKLDQEPAPTAASPAETAETAEQDSTDSMMFYKIETAEGVKVVPALVEGASYSFDKVEFDEFNAAQWLLTAPAETILELAKNGWEVEYTNDVLGKAFQIWGENIEVTHSYVSDNNSTQDPAYWTKLGVELDVKQAMRFLRAFRYPLFVQLELQSGFVAPGANRLREHSSVVAQEGSSEWAAYHPAVGYARRPTEAEAWTWLGYALEDIGGYNTTDEVSISALKVVRQSGFVSTNPDQFA